MNKSDIISIHNLSIMQRKILDTEFPVGFEAEMSQLKELNKIMLDITTGQREFASVCRGCGADIYSDNWEVCPVCRLVL